MSHTYRCALSDWGSNWYTHLLDYWY